MHHYVYPSIFLSVVLCICSFFAVYLSFCTSALLMDSLSLFTLEKEQEIDKLGENIEIRLWNEWIPQYMTCVYRRTDEQSQDR